MKSNSASRDIISNHSAATAVARKVKKVSKSNSTKVMSELFQRIEKQRKFAL